MPKNKTDTHQQLTFDGIPETRGVTFKTQVVTFTRFDEIARNDMPEELAALLDGILKRIDAKELNSEQGILEFAAGLDAYRAEQATHAETPPAQLQLEPVSVTTKYPAKFIAPTDEVNERAFTGELIGKELKAIKLEGRGSKNQIKTLVSVDIDALKNVEIRGKTDLTPYDRVVHNAIVTLYVDGGNEYITPQMIYQVMTGDSMARLSEGHAQAISDSITKCMYSRVVIHADDAAKAHGYDSFKYDGNMILSERATVTLNGETLECLHIVRRPVLYEYASMRKQIDRVDIRLLDSPINKNEEAISIQDYLLQRVNAMKNSKAVSRTILYDTIYSRIDLGEVASAAAARNKKARTRTQVKKILGYWTENKFISGYDETNRGQEAYSVTLQLK